jgi:hypothetical protein
MYKTKTIPQALSSSLANSLRNFQESRKTMVISRELLTRVLVTIMYYSMNRKKKRTSQRGCVGSLMRIVMAMRN